MFQMKLLVVTRSILYLIRLLPLARIFGVIAIAAKEFVQMEMDINLKKDDLNITVTLFFKSEDSSCAKMPFPIPWQYFP